MATVSVSCTCLKCQNELLRIVLRGTDTGSNTSASFYPSSCDWSVCDLDHHERMIFLQDGHGTEPPPPPPSPPSPPARSPFSVLLSWDEGPKRGMDALAGFSETSDSQGPPNTWNYKITCRWPLHIAEKEHVGFFSSPGKTSEEMQETRDSKVTAGHHTGGRREHAWHPPKQHCSCISWIYELNFLCVVGWPWHLWL